MHFRFLIGLSLAALGGMVATPAAASAASTAQVDAHTAHLRVMTFNVRFPSPDDGINVWPKRRDLMVKVIKEQHPDVLGTEELYTRQGNYLASHLADYKWFGLGRFGNHQDGHENEHMGVFYNTRRVRVINQGNFWLSDTPDVPGSNTWHQPFPRMVTWAEFQLKDSGKRFYYYDTHLPYRTGDVELRKRGARIILDRIAEVPADEPVILGGDFNSTPGGPTHALLTGTLQDARTTAAFHAGPAHTFHDFTGQPVERIDWILYRGLKATDERTVTTHAGKVYPSDHFPVVADFIWPSGS